MKKVMLLITSILLVLTTSIAFSALSTSLAITSEVKFRFIDDIRINSVTFVSASNGAQIAYESDYSKYTASTGFTLPNAGSSITYRIHVDNSGDTDYSIYEILRQSNNNGLSVSISGYNVQDVIPKKTSVDLVITYTTSNPSQSVINVVETLNYKKVYYVEYETGTAQTIADQIKYEGVNLTLSSTVPTKTGYTFQRWNTESDGSGTNYSAGASYTLDEDVTLYARYTKNTYTINYTMNSGPNPSVKPTTGTYDEDVVISNPADKTVTITGNANNTNATVGSATSNTQVFTGWTNSTLGSNAKRGTTASPSTAWDGTSTTDTYFKNLVDSGTTTMVANWSGNGTLPTLTKRGNECKWYDAANNGNELGSGGDPIALNSDSPANITVYAQCVVTAFKVEYDTTENGGTGTIPEDYVPYGEPVDLTPTATKTGWTFVGWNTDKDATSALSSLTMGIDDITLYAIYRKEAVPLTASWHGNGATLSSSDPSTCNIPAVYNKAVQGTSCEVTAPTVTRLGYDFIGWNQVSSSITNDSSYDTATNKLTITTTTTGHTWYAITKAANPLTATFAANNGATVSPSSATCYLYNGSESCVVDGPTVTAQTGFNHIGFSMNQNATANSSSYNATTNKLTISGDSTWYPITKSASQYTGTFIIQDPNAATQSGGTPSCYRYNGGTECNIVAPTLTAKTGYEVVGWDKNQTGETAAYASGATIAIDGNTIFYSKTYYKTVVTITFNRNVTNAHTISLTPAGGTASTETTVPVTCNKYNGATTCNITSPSMQVSTGYHAVGYGTSASATTSSWNVETLKTVTTDATYYAITAGNTYTIAFNANCPAGITATGSMSNMTMTYGTARNLTANAFGCAGRVFSGWTMNQDGTGETFDDEESVSNLTTETGTTVNLYGKWRLNPPTPTISGGQTKVYGSSTTTLTCTENTTYPSGVVKYYSFGYATQENGTPSGWSDVSTSNTRTISADAYIGERWYSCRVYASDGNELSDTIVSSNTTKMTLKNATITYKAGSCSTITGQNPGYVNNTMTGVYTGATNTTAGTIPTASKSGYTFMGWYASNVGKNLLNIKAGQSAPSSTTSANTTKRTFTLNTAIIGLAYNNYFNANGVSSFSINNDAIVMTAGSGYGVAYPILSAPNKTYTFSYNMASSGTGLSAVMYYQSDGTLIDYVRTDGNGDKTITFTTPANTHYLVLQFACSGSTTITVSNVQLEEGSTKTYYEPYRDLMTGNELGVYNVESTYSNGVYTMTKNVGYAGYYIPEGVLEDGKTYILSYDIQKTAGTFVNIGGHSEAATELEFKIDGANSPAIYHTPASNMSSKNDNNIHKVYFKFRYKTGTSDDKIYIQPNRSGAATAITVKISNLVLYEADTLPSGYTKVNYIESTTTQYIDTGTKFNTNVDKLELVYQATDADGNYMIAGSGNSENGKVWIYSYKNGNRFAIYATDTGGTQREFFGLTGTDTLRHTVLLDAKKLYVDGTMTADNSSYTFGETPANMTLFKSGIPGYNAKTKIYSFKMWRSGTLTRDMVPCIKDSTGEAGMYDLVGNTFYGNSGTGEFIVGNSPRVISSDGTIQPGVAGWTDSNSKWLATEDRELVARCTPNYTVTFNYQNNVYNQDVNTWTMHGSTNVDRAYQYNNTISAAVYSNASQYTGLVIPLNSDVKTNTNYRLSFYAKRTASISGSLRIYVATRDSSNNVISWNHNLNVTDSTATQNTWTAFATTFNSGSYSVIDPLRFDYGNANQGPVYVSDIRLDEYTTQTKSYEGTYGSMPTPTRTGYTFAGWYTAPSGGTQVTNSTQNNVPGDHTLYARWTPNNYTLTVNPNSGSFNGSTSNTTYSQAFDTQKVLPLPTRTGYTFNGWTKSGAGTVTKYGTPKFSEPLGSISVYNNSGGGTVTHTSVSRSSDSPILTSSTMLQIRTAGTASPGLGGFYQGVTSRANAVFYHVIVAKIPVGYTIEHAQNPTGDNRVITWLTPQQGTGKFETYIYKHVCGSTGSFSTFGHVYINGTAATSSNPVTWYVAYAQMFDASAGVPNASSQVFRYGAGATTLTANWTQNIYAITLNQQSGSGGTGTIYEKYGSGYYTNSGATTQMTTSANGITVPSRTGYTFGGYYTSTGGGGTQYIGTNGRITSSASSTNFTAAGSLYAKWTPVSYSISYNLNSGSVSGNPTSYTIETASFTLRNPSRTGYTFTGWTGTGLSSASTSVTVAKGSTGNRSYTANWSANSYYLDVNGLLSGKSSGSTEQCGTFDVYTGGTLRANDVNDYYAQWVTGTTYSISDVKGKNGCTYNGVSSGSASGTITGSNVAVQLKFTRAAQNYGYTGGMQSYTVPITGTYKLQVWGAQGGYGTNGSNSGGLGGYSYGNKSLTAGNVIYIGVGGQGQQGGKNGGYNGGGTGTKYAGSTSGQGGGGGGLTHIGTQNALLRNYGSSYRNATNVFVVAGGGGGATEGSGGTSRAGGSGGGTAGGAGTGGWYPGGGANQVNVGAAGDTDAQPGGFGYGGDAADGNTEADTYGSGGGGGGWYGGGGASHAGGYGFTPASGGGGGSGYIGGVSSGSTTAGQRSGSGYATISFVS